MIKRTNFTAHVAYRGGETTLPVVAGGWIQAAEAIVTQNLGLFPVSRETGSDEHRFVMYDDATGDKGYMTVLVTATGSVISRTPHFPPAAWPTRFEPPPIRKYRIKARGWPELTLWSDDISEAVNDYFYELTEDTEFNPKVNQDIPVRIWTENLKDPSLVHVWNWRADVETEIVARTYGRERAELMKKELVA